jgi:hypothetical protein
MEKEELFRIIRHLPLADEKEEKSFRFPPEIDELSLILSNEIVNKLSQEFPLKLSLYEWSKFKNIIHSQLAHTIRQIKFTPPPYPPSLEVNWDSKPYHPVPLKKS